MRSVNCCGGGWDAIARHGFGGSCSVGYDATRRQGSITGNGTTACRHDPLINGPDRHSRITVIAGQSLKQELYRKLDTGAFEQAAKFAAQIADYRAARQ